MSGMLKTQEHVTFLPPFLYPFFDPISKIFSSLLSFFLSQTHLYIEAVYCQSTLQFAPFFCAAIADWTGPLSPCSPVCDIICECVGAWIHPCARLSLGTSMSSSRAFPLFYTSEQRTAEIAKKKKSSSSLLQAFNLSSQWLNHPFVTRLVTAHVSSHYHLA